MVNRTQCFRKVKWTLYHEKIIPDNSKLAIFEKTLSVPWLGRSHIAKGLADGLASEEVELLL